MDIIHLPPDAVALINMLSAEDADVEAAREAFGPFRESTTRWLRFQGAFTVDEAEAGLLNLIANRWDDVDQALQEQSPQAALEKLLPAIYQAVEASERVARGRSRAHFALQPALNDLLLAGAAWLHGRGELRGLEERLPVADQYLANLASLYEGSEERLRPEVREEIEKGFRHLRAGLDGLRAASESSRDEVHARLSQVRAGAELTAHFLDWDRMDQERLAGQYHRFAIPIIGPEMELALESARKVPRQLWVRPVQHTRQTLLPRLRGWWEHNRDAILMPAAQRAWRLQDVDQRLEALEEAVAAMLDEEATEEAALENLEASLEALSDAFCAIDEEAFRSEGLQGTRAGTYFEVFSGVLSRTVPDAALFELLDAAPPPSAWNGVREAIDGWLRGEGPEALCDGAAALLETGRTDEQPAADTWSCLCCGRINPSGIASCPRCGARPVGGDTGAGWEA